MRRQALRTVLLAGALLAVVGFSHGVSAPPRRSVVVNKSFKLIPGIARLGPYTPTRYRVHPPEPPETPIPHGKYRPVKARGPQASVVRHAQAQAADGPTDPITITTNTDFGGILRAWEPNVASSGRVVFFTGNWGAAYSVDSGKTFAAVSPKDLLARAPKSDPALGFADQVVTYVPKYDLFVWVVQTGASAKNENRYRIAVSTPAEITSSKAGTWHYWDLFSKDLAGPGVWFDYEEVSFGDKYLYLAFNVVGAGKMGLVRMPLAELAAEGKLSGRIALPTGWNLRPVQNVGTREFFATHVSDSRLKIFAWDDSAVDPVVAGTVDIPTVATRNWSLKVADGTDALPESAKIGWNMQGATKAGNELWLAWSAGRDVVVDDKGTTKTVWPYPHVEIAVVDATSLKLLRMQYLWNKDLGFMWPALATNAAGEVGASYNWGGGSLYTYHGVGILNGTRSLAATTFVAGPSQLAGGHYVGIRPHYPKGECFSAAGYSQTPIGLANRPRYVLFGRKGTACDPPPAKAPTVSTGPAVGIGGTAATMTGTVNPNGSETKWWFEWGTTTAYGATTPARNAGSGTAGVAVAEFLSGLPSGTTYHYNLVGDSEPGTVSDGDRTFTTLSPPPPPPPATPLADLVISSLMKNSFTVKNQGAAAATGFTVAVTNSNVGTSTFNFAGLAAGAEVSQDFFCNAGHVTATADSADAVRESNETNNSTSIDVVGCIS